MRGKFYPWPLKPISQSLYDSKTASLLNGVITRKKIVFPGSIRYQDKLNLKNQRPQRPITLVTSLIPCHRRSPQTRAHKKVTARYRQRIGDVDVLSWYLPPLSSTPREWGAVEVGLGFLSRALLAYSYPTSLYIYLSNTRYSTFTAVGRPNHQIYIASLAVLNRRWHVAESTTKLKAIAPTGPSGVNYHSKPRPSYHSKLDYHSGFEAFIRNCTN